MSITTPLPGAPAVAAVARDADEVLGSARAARARADAAEVRVLVDAVEWAVLNPPLFGREAATWYAPTRQGSAPDELELSAEGVPDVDRAAVGELGIALDVSTQAAQRLLGDALELAFRLPAVWTRLVAGEVKPWQARRIAQATRRLSKLAAAFVDREIAPAADRVNGHQLDGLIATAMARHDADLAEQIAAERAEHRDVQVRLDQTGLGGLTEVNGWVDLPDALDLDAALSHSAAQLAAWGSEDPLNVRRARALGELAREHLTFTGQPTHGGGEDPEHDAFDDTGADPASGTGGSGAGSTDAGVHGGVRVRPRRQVVLYVHLTDATIYDMISHGTSAVAGPGTGTASGAGAVCGTSSDRWRVPVWVGRVENTATPITAQTIQDWCADPDTRLSVRPVLDLNGNQQADSYEVPARIKEQVRLRDGTCVFPNCHAKALYCQDDHVQPYDHDNPAQGGATESTGLRLLCQRHHNLKTHHGFRYTVLTNGAVLWRTPHGLRIRRNRDGTLDYLTRHRARYAPDDSDDGSDSGDGDKERGTSRTAARSRRRRGIPGWDAIDGFEALSPADPTQDVNVPDDLGPPPF